TQNPPSTRLTCLDSRRVLFQSPHPPTPPPQALAPINLLPLRQLHQLVKHGARQQGIQAVADMQYGMGFAVAGIDSDRMRLTSLDPFTGIEREAQHLLAAAALALRSEERRVGKKGSFAWATEH